MRFTNLKVGDIVAVHRNWLDLSGNDVGIVMKTDDTYVVVRLLFRVGDYNESGYWFTAGQGLEKLAGAEELHDLD